MMGNNSSVADWRSTMKTWLHPRVITMLFLGFSAGIPILLIFSTLSAWLREAGVERSAVTFFSWAALGYSFKFIWAPLIDRLPLPWLTARLGRRRAWMMVSQMMIITAILWMGSIDPARAHSALNMMAMAAVLLGFSSATQDIVIDAYRIESAGEELQAMLSATYIAGYRIAMIVASAGCLILADSFGSTKGAYNYQAWQLAYYAVACCMLIGIVTTFVIAEPERATVRLGTYRATEYARFFLLFICTIAVFILSFFYGGTITETMKGIISENWPLSSGVIAFLVESVRLLLALLAALAAARLLVLMKLVDRKMVDETYIAPVSDFFVRYGMKSALLLLLLVGFYRISDIVLGVISVVFYVDLGFSKTEIAAIVQTFGVVMTIAGGFLGGILTVRYGVIKILLAGAVLASATNFLFMMLAGMEPNIYVLKLVIAADNLAAGIATAAFVAFLSGLTSVSFTAVQYAIFSSLMTLFPKLIGGYSGTIVDSIGYQSFFMMTALMGIPVILLIWFVRKVK